MNERLKRLALGDPGTIAGTVYGTIVVMSIIAAGAHPYEHQLWRLVVLAGGSAVVLWLAHVYSPALGESWRTGPRFSLRCGSGWRCSGLRAFVMRAWSD